MTSPQYLSRDPAALGARAALWRDLGVQVVRPGRHTRLDAFGVTDHIARRFEGG